MVTINAGMSYFNVSCNMGRSKQLTPLLGPSIEEVAKDVLAPSLSKLEKLGDAELQIYQ